MLAVMSWLAILFFEKPILLFFGADSSLLPLADSIWFAMPVTELLVAIYAVFMMNKYTSALSKEMNV